MKIVYNNNNNNNNKNCVFMKIMVNIWKTLGQNNGFR